MALLLRSRRPKFRGYTDAQGMRTPDAPKNWPFGRVATRPSKAKPKNPASIRNSVGDALL